MSIIITIGEILICANEYKIISLWRDSMTKMLWLFH